MLSIAPNGFAHYDSLQKLFYPVGGFEVYACAQGDYSPESEIQGIPSKVYAAKAGAGITPFVFVYRVPEWYLPKTLELQRAGKAYLINSEVSLFHPMRKNNVTSERSVLDRVFTCAIADQQIDHLVEFVDMLRLFGDDSAYRLRVYRFDLAGEIMPDPSKRLHNAKENQKRADRLGQYSSLRRRVPSGHESTGVQPDV